VRAVAWIAVLCLGATACATLDRNEPESARVPAPGGQQILVMLRMSPRHYGPGLDSPGAYGTTAGDRARRRLAEALAQEYRLRLLTNWPMPALAVECFVMQLPTESSAAHALQQLSRDPRVESVQPMGLFHTLGHNDPLYLLEPSARLWHLSALHRVTTGRRVVVAEVDTGVERGHPDLRGQIAEAHDLVDGGDNPGAERHGTAVAGVIAARADDGIGIAGVAPEARLLVLRACWEDRAGASPAHCSSFTLAKALQVALDRHVQVINLSLSGPFDRLLQRLIEVALADGITVVSAVDPLAPDGGFPAANPGVVAVAADDAPETAAGFLRAPGRDIPATLPGGRWGFVNGSSFAAAEVSGLVALLHQLIPGISPEQARRVLATAPAPPLRGQPPLRVDACAAIARLEPSCRCD
jgi:Subtilase family